VKGFWREPNLRNGAPLGLYPGTLDRLPLPSQMPIVEGKSERSIMMAHASEVHTSNLKGPLLLLKPDIPDNWSPSN
jgi:hypothetical protein